MIKTDDRCLLTDERGPRDSTCYWAGVTNGHDGQGWTDDRREAMEFASRDEVGVDLKLAWSSMPGAGPHTWIEILALEDRPESEWIGQVYP